MLVEDRDLKPRDIQGLSSREALVSFFASLGYNVDGRITQTPEALSITAEATSSK